MIFVTKKFLFSKALILLDDAALLETARKNKYSYVSAISYNAHKLNGWRRKEKETALIDLVLSEEEIFKRFNDTTRNEIRRSYADENLVVSYNKQDFSELYRLYSNFENMQGRKPMNKNEASQYLPFAIRYKSEIICGQFVYASPPYLRIRSIFSKRMNNPDKNMLKVISNGGRRLMWEICRWGKQRGYRSLDMASVNQSDSNTINIAKFKMSFGGNIITEYTYIYKTSFFFFFEKLLALRRI